MPAAETGSNPGAEGARPSLAASRRRQRTALVERRKDCYQPEWPAVTDLQRMGALKMHPLAAEVVKRDAMRINIAKALIRKQAADRGASTRWGIAPPRATTPPAVAWSCTTPTPAAPRSCSTPPGATEAASTPWAAASPSPTTPPATRPSSTTRAASAPPPATTPLNRLTLQRYADGVRHTYSLRRRRQPHPRPRPHRAVHVHLRRQGPYHPGALARGQARQLLLRRRRTAAGP